MQLAEFGNEEAVRDATREQILESEAITRMMDWFKQQGWEKPRLDTPAEFKLLKRHWRQLVDD